MSERSRTTVVTGAASGIGAATADLLRGRGQEVISVDLHDADVCVDLATPDGRARLVTDVGDRSQGRIDAVVAAAGTNRQGPLDIAVNFFGAVATLEGLRPLLARGDSPRAVAVSSFAILEGVVDEVVAACLDGDEAAALAVDFDDPFGVRGYSSAKRALARWVRRTAVTDEWARSGIALNAVAPGVIRTPMTEDMLASDEAMEVLTAMVPMPFGGIAEPDAVAHLLTFLASPNARSITGQVVFVDGGADCVRRGDDVFGTAP